MIVVRTADSLDATHSEADAYKVKEDGSLSILRYGCIGRYRCPLRLEQVATYAPGQWKGVEVKDE